VNTLLLGLAIISFVCGAIFTWMIASFLTRRGEKINYWLLRYKMLGYLRRYKELTNEENGTTGTLYYGYIASIVLGVLFLILGVLLAGTPLL
jgi:predicted PurR-regulated permease PerM